MKKLLSLLGTVGLIATSSATVVSCGDPDKGTSNNGGNDDDKTTIKELSYFLDITPEDGVYDLGSVTYNEGADKIEIPGYDGMVVLLSHVLSGLITSHVNRMDCVKSLMSSNSILMKPIQPWIMSLGISFIKKKMLKPLSTPLPEIVKLRMTDIINYKPEHIISSFR
jgi:hypothetical protein